MLFGMLLPLSACLADQKRETARCATEGMRTYPHSDHAAMNDRGTYVQKCMEAAGYEWSWSDDECQPSDFIAQNPYCYRPADFMGRLILRAQLYLIRGK